MRIANAKIPLANEWPAVISNGAYLVTAVVLVALFGWIATPVALALTVQAWGSVLYHATPRTAGWAQLMDSVGIQWVMAALLALAVHTALSVPLWASYSLLPIAWLLWWRYAHRVDRIASIAVQSAAVLGLALGVAAWWAVGLVTLVGVGAVAIQRTAPSHSVAHAIWHLLSALAQAASVWLFL